MFAKDKVFKMMYVPNRTYTLYVIITSGTIVII